MGAPEAGSLAAALEHEARDYDEAIDGLRALVDAGVVQIPHDLELYDLARKLRNSAELVRSLRRLVDVSTTQEIHGAFGAPGDWGYGTPVGAALASLYRGTKGGA